MTITITNGPLSPTPPATVNYTLDGPKNKMLFSPFPRRVRAVFGGEVVLDTDDGMLLHESGLLPALYVPVADVRTDLLTKAEHTTHCPYKGDASYWTITANGDTSQNAVWGYEIPVESAAFIKGFMALYWERVDQWLDEDEEVFGHLRDPYHHIDIRPTSRAITASINGRVVAETTGAYVLSETGLPNRYYIPEADVRAELFTTSNTSTHCPYKGDTNYRSLADTEAGADIAWIYADPFDESVRIAGYWSFDSDRVTIAG